MKIKTLLIVFLLLLTFGCFAKEEIFAENGAFLVNNGLLKSNSNEPYIVINGGQTEVTFVNNSDFWWTVVGKVYNSNSRIMWSVYPEDFFEFGVSEDETECYVKCNKKGTYILRASLVQDLSVFTEITVNVVSKGVTVNGGNDIVMNVGETKNVEAFSSKYEDIQFTTDGDGIEINSGNNNCDITAVKPGNYLLRGFDSTYEQTINVHVLGNIEPANKEYKLEFSNGTYNDKTLENYGYSFNIGTSPVYLVVTCEDLNTHEKTIVPNKDLIWKSDNWNGARVINGCVEGKTLNATANISVSLKDSSWSGECEVYVEPKGIEIINETEAKEILKPGKEYKLIANVNPGGTVDHCVKWETSNWNVCSVYPAYEVIDNVRVPVCYVHCKKLGKCEIKCYFDFNTLINASIEIDNSEPEPINRTVTILSNDTEKFPIYVIGDKKYIDCDINAKDIPLCAKMDVGQDNNNVIWTSENWNNARVIYGSNGAYVTPKTIGSVTAVTCYDKINNTLDTVYINVKNTDKISILYNEAEVNEIIKIHKGEQINLTANSYSGNVLVGGNNTVNWSTDAAWNDARFVSNKSGGAWITGKKVGIYTVTATSTINSECNKEIIVEVID